MKLGVAALIATLTGAFPALAAPASEPAQPLRTFLDSFNKGDAKAADATYAKGSIAIVDEFAPHAWSGPNAPHAWAAEYDRHAKATGVTDGRVTYGAPTRVEMAGDLAYVVMPTLYLYKERGRPTAEEGSITGVIHREGGAWKIRAWTWSGVKPHPAKP
jgi:hypothetical protein